MVDEAAEGLDPEPKPLPPPWDRIFSLGTKIFVWVLLAAILYALRPFLLLVFLTFVFAYILEHGVEGLKHRIKSRPTRVVLVAFVFIGTLVTLAIALAPPFQAQAQKIGREFPDIVNRIDVEIGKARKQYSWLEDLLPEDVRFADVLAYLVGLVEDGDEEVLQPATGPDTVAALPPDFIGPPAPWTARLPRATRTSVTERSSQMHVAEAVELLKDIAIPLLTVTSAFLLSLLFAVLIVLDLPRLSRAVHGLKRTRLQFIYDEAAESIHDFGKMVGRALEAQAVIAVCNTVLTAFGLWLLGITDNLVFLSTVVFLFSFIPVVGVWLSSIPICAEAMSIGGFQLMLGAAVMITLVHAFEAYVLNPRIFGHHLRMNPVLVLIVLTVSGQLVGFWGFILGLPIANYVFGHAIRRKPTKGMIARREAAGP